MISSNKIKIYYHCNDVVLSKWIADIFIQQEIFLNFKKDEKNSLKITLDQKYIRLSLNNLDKKIFLPVPFTSLKKIIFELINTIEFDFQGLKYFPYLGIIQTLSSKIKLSDNYNIILSNLFDNKDGIKKEKLYSCLWPSNKEYAINKLDTHLTNLKNFLKQNCSLDFQFKSQKGLLKLI